jgi:hypothetical protein
MTSRRYSKKYSRSAQNKKSAVMILALAEAAKNTKTVTDNKF